MIITRTAFDDLRAHAAEGYPSEICGILSGPQGEGRATRAWRARNIIVERARDRYEIDPLDQIRIQRECDEMGLDIVGYYHSHPDHPAQASVFDTERAWAGYFYVIVQVQKGEPKDTNAFAAEADGGPFHPEVLEVVGA